MPSVPSQVARCDSWCLAAAPAAQSETAGPQYNIYQKLFGASVHHANLPPPTMSYQSDRPSTATAQPDRTAANLSPVQPSPVTSRPSSGRLHSFL